MARSDSSFTIFEGCVVEEVQLFKVVLRVLVKENRGATLALELNVEHVLGVRDLKDFELNVGALNQGHEFALLLFSVLLGRLSVDLLLDLEVDAHIGFRDSEFLSFLAHLATELGKNLLWRHRREEAMRAIGAFDEVFHLE